MAARISEQVETAADYHAPATYGLGSGSPLSLLTFWNNLEVQADPLSFGYVPLSSVAQRGRNPKIFAVGVIPPSANVTGKLLDRSASVANVQGALNSPPHDEVVSSITNTTLGSSQQGLKGANLPTEFWVDYVGMCRRLGVDPVELAAVIESESGWDPTAVNYQGPDHHPVAKGLNQITKSTGVRGVGMTPETWDNFETLSAQEQLPYVETYFSKARVRGADKGQIYVKNFGGHANNPTIEGSKPLYIGRAGFDKLSPEQQAAIANPEVQFKQYAQNAGADHSGKGYITGEDLAVNVATRPQPGIRRRISEASGIVGSGIPPKPSAISGDGAANTYGNSAKSAAQAAQKQLDKTVASPLNSSELGQQFQAAQRAQIAATATALEQMRNTPPLRMLVNPQSLSFRDSKITSDGNWGREGPIIEHWGDDQTKLSASGKVAAFYSMDVANASGPGLTRNSRNFSQSWQNFQALYLLYRNNGGVYLPDAASSTERQKNLSLIGSMYIYYDNALHIGSFDNFNITETDSSPFTVEYSFDFSIRASFMLDRADDKFTYGAPDFFKKPQLQTQNSSQPTDNSPEFAQIAAMSAALDASLGVNSESQIVTPNPDPRIQAGLTPQAIAENQETRQRAQSRFESGAITLEMYDFILSQHPIE